MKRIALMQPYFLPYVGYFSLMHAVDNFVIFDIPQFPRKGWVHRNRLPNRDGDGFFYFRIPTQKQIRETAIHDIHINEQSNWRKTIKEQIKSRYKTSEPFQKSTLKLVDDLLSFNSIFLHDFVTNSLKITASHLNITTQIEDNCHAYFQDKSGFKGDEWALEFCSRINTPIHYINLINGKYFYRREEFISRGAKISFLRHHSLDDVDSDMQYSILHLLMTYPIDEIKDKIQSFDLN